MSISSGSTPCARQVVHPRPVLPVPVWPNGPLLIIADAGVNKDGQPLGADQVTAERHDDITGGRINAVGFQPAPVPVHFRFGRIRIHFKRIAINPFHSITSPTANPPMFSPVIHLPRHYFQQTNRFLRVRSRVTQAPNIKNGGRNEENCDCTHTGAIRQFRAAVQAAGRRIVVR